MNQRITGMLRRFFLLLAAGTTVAIAAGQKPAVTKSASPVDPSPTIAQAASVIPVLPLPHYINTGASSSKLHPIQTTWLGVDPKTIHRLEQYAPGSSSTSHSPLQPKFRLPNPSSSRPPDPSPTNTLHIGILGADTSFDSLIHKLAAPWQDSIGSQGYILVIDKNHQLLAARSDTGLFYGLQSLKQLMAAGWDKEVFIADWPAFPCRAIYDDISRGPISTVAYIREQIDRMSAIKINYLSFYIEHVVKTVSHPDFAPENGSLTIAQVKELSAYAAEHYMQLIGSFQSFGHFEKILSLPEYASMGATSNLISPTDPRAKKFLADVIGELCDAFNAPWFNVNCDETFDLGQGTTKPYVDSMGTAAFYALHLANLYNVVKAHGKKMMVWGDVALQHPQILDMLPKDITWLTWEYGDQSSYDAWIKPFADRHLDYMVCPGILNTYRLFPDMTMARDNITGFSRQGYRQGASGVLTTIWDDGSAYLFSGDWYGVYVTADKSWNVSESLSAPHASRSSTIQPGSSAHASPSASIPATASFDKRYAFTAYGSCNDAYTRALFTLMRLKDIPLTYNLSESPWRQQLLPDSGKNLIINNNVADSVLSLLEQAARTLGNAHPLRNLVDIRTLSFAIDQYRLLIRSRLILAKIAKTYMQASSGRKPASAGLSAAITTIDSLRNGYIALRDRFRTAWLAEDQPYWLDRAMQPFDVKITALTRLSNDLSTAKTRIAKQQPLLPPSAIHLAIYERPYYYFQGWMLAGAFPAAAHDSFPSFLYAEDAEYNKPPSPGDFTKYQGKLYRWKKYFSDQGGIIDVGQIYPGGQPAFVYAYCQINSDTSTAINAFISIPGRSKVYCNGKSVKIGSPGSLTDNESLITLPLKRGANHILIKLERPSPDAVTPSAIKPEASNPNTVTPSSIKRDAINPNTVTPDASKLSASKPSPVKAGAVSPSVTPGPITPSGLWTFTFRIQPDIPFTNHKHKYSLNGTNKLHAAD